MDDLPLGRQIEVPARYWPEALVAIPRAQARSQIDLDQIPPHGWDRWIAWELCWRDEQDALQAGVLDIFVPVDSPNIFESKSLKLYFNSLFYKDFISLNVLLVEIQDRLSEIAGAQVKLEYSSLQEAEHRYALASPQGVNLDQWQPLAKDTSVLPVVENSDTAQPDGVSTLYFTHVFRSLCPVTGQPDWASVFVEVTGVRLNEPSLLKYLRSFADHQGFHEQCVERIYAEIWRQCLPQSLAVTARYTRRGGIEINPFRSSSAQLKEQNIRIARQ